MNQPVLMPVHSLAAAVLGLLAPAVLEAPDCGCLRGSTIRDPYRIWERLGPLFCK
jgi:hypothetical protein